MHLEPFANTSDKDEEQGKSESKKLKAENSNVGNAALCDFSFQLSDLSFPSAQPVPELDEFSDEELDDLFAKLEGA
ncbi:MAG: hypothetical protein EOM24_30495 [Chloroflexia bacterium]|nr:hypothetical protein [Chloroflexia bacterium]